MRLTRSCEKVVEGKGGHIQPVCGATTYKNSGKRFETLSVVSVIEITRNERVEKDLWTTIYL